KVIGPKEHADNTGKLREQDLNDLKEAELLQKQVQSILGAKEDEGLRDDIARLFKTIKDNNLPPSDTQDRLKAVQNELARVQRELAQIEPRLANARGGDVDREKLDEKEKIAKQKQAAAREKDELAKRQRKDLVEELAKGFELSEDLKEKLDKEVKKFLEKD